MLGCTGLETPTFRSTSMVSRAIALGPRQNGSTAVPVL